MTTISPTGKFLPTTRSRLRLHRRPATKPVVTRSARGAGEKPGQLGWRPRRARRPGRARTWTRPRARSMTRAVGLLVAMLAISAGCGRAASETSGDKKLIIAVIPKGTTHEFWKSVHFGA